MNTGPKVNLISWISTGELAGILPGDPKERVRDFFGVPPGWAHSETLDETADFMNADMWGYGAWTLYFEGACLDAITCPVPNVEEHGWFFDIDALDKSFFNDVQGAEKILLENGIPCVQLKGALYKIKDVATGETLESRRRLIQPTLLAGSEFQTRITFDAENEKMHVIANPFSLKRQVVSKRRLDPQKKYTLVF